MVDKVQIEIDGKTFSANKGAMIIEVADEAGIPIPRFCYHKKLSVAANCRMCLVEVEKAPKALPACATPVMEGMKVFTKSQVAKEAQQAVMEFLLINHPLDCPICDQGGECELQDVSMGYGEDISRFVEGKRAVADEDLGPLISTEMTRCIHCTRCVRFGEEVAGLRELGATFRGEDMKIGTYVGKSLTSELSGNIIDLCPVGALTSKPYRFTARAWELRQWFNVSPHDCVGSNLHVNTRRDVVMRVLPKDNEAVNECWISDRDRFSYTALKSPNRLTTPMIKEAGVWKEVDWVTALTEAATRMQAVLADHGPEQFAAILSPSTTLEAGYLTQKWLRTLEVNNIDHRLRQTDFHDQMQQPLAPVSDCKLAELEQQQAILLVGSHAQKEQPMANHRIRKASLNGAHVMAINAVDYATNYTISEKLIQSPDQMATALAAVVKAACDGKTPAGCDALFKHVEVTDAAKAIAAQLKAAEHAVIVMGTMAIAHPHASMMRFLINTLAKACHTKRIFLTEGANSAGLSMVGVLPHRALGGKAVSDTGLHALACFMQPRKGYLLMGVEPELDTAAQANAAAALKDATCVIQMTAFVSDTMKEYADILLPIAPFTQEPGTYVNMEGTWQSFQAAAVPEGDARPAWKIIRVLANLFKCKGFEFEHYTQVREAIEKELKQTPFSLPDANYVPEWTPLESGLNRYTTWPLYRVDQTVREAAPLQAVAGIKKPCVYVHSELARALKLGEHADVSQDGAQVTLPVEIDDTLALNTAYVPAGFAETAALTRPFGPITVRAQA